MRENYESWISTEDKLPNDGDAVLIFDGEIGVARFYRGISAEERQKMKNGEIADEDHVLYSSGRYRKCKRSDMYCPEDEWVNNKVPYRWKALSGPMEWFGQDVTHWMPLPEPPKPKREDNCGNF